MLVFSAVEARAQDAPTPGLLGDLGGLRPQLATAGIDLQMGYVLEGAYNPSGVKDEATEAGQISFGATFDLQKLWNIPNTKL